MTHYDNYVMTIYIIYLFYIFKHFVIAIMFTLYTFHGVIDSLIFLRDVYDKCEKIDQFQRKLINQIIYFGYKIA